MVGPKSDTKYSLEQINQAISKAQDAAKAIDSAAADLPEAELKKLKAASYRGFAELAEAVTLLHESPDNAKAARAASLALLQTFVNDTSKLNQIGLLGSVGMTSPYRKGTGIVLAGRAQETTPVGKLFRTRLELLGAKTPTEVFVITSEEPSAKPQDTVLLLGTIVSKPAENLHDYEGTEETVIWASAMGPVPMETPMP